MKLKDVKTGVSGVYLIQCTENGRNYIGSSKCIRRRWSSHIRELDKKIHHSIKLQEDWIKYGEDKFVFEILIECSHADSKKYELEYIQKFNSDKFGYNMNDFANSLRRRSELTSSLIFEYAQKNGYEPDGNAYWFNIFDVAQSLNMKATKLLEFFGVNSYKRWNITRPINEETYCGLNWDEEDGVQMVVLHKLFFEKDDKDFIKCF